MRSILLGDFMVRSEGILRLLVEEGRMRVEVGWDHVMKDSSFLAGTYLDFRDTSNNLVNA